MCNASSTVLTAWPVLTKADSSSKTNGHYAEMTQTVLECQGHSIGRQWRFPTSKFPRHPFHKFGTAHTLEWIHLRSNLIGGEKSIRLPMISNDHIFLGMAITSRLCHELGVGRLGSLLLWSMCHVFLRVYVSWADGAMMSTASLGISTHPRRRRAPQGKPPATLGPLGEWMIGPNWTSHSSRENETREIWEYILFITIHTTLAHSSRAPTIHPIQHISAVASPQWRHGKPWRLDP